MSEPMENFQKVVGQYLDAYEMDTFRSLVPERLLSKALNAVAAAAWSEGQGAGTVAAINFTPLEANPYADREPLNTEREA